MNERINYQTNQPWIYKHTNSSMCQKVKRWEEVERVHYSTVLHFLL